MPANNVFDGPIKTLLSVLCILIEILLWAVVKGAKGLNEFKFGVLIGCFQSDGMASMAVKGLR